MQTTPALEFLLARRSRPAKMLGAPGPDRAVLERLLTAAMRVPDHGKLEPWRFVVLEPAALQRVAGAVAARAADCGHDAEKTAKGVDQFARSPLCVVVVASPKPSEKIPEIEQTLSVGGACLSLLNAALASGWGANWLSGWPAYDRVLAEDTFGLAPHEWVAGFIHIGSCEAVPPERPRPELAARVQWVAG